MTPLRRLLADKIGGDLDTYVAERRDVGRSWRAIARDLRDETGIDVTDEILRRWFTESARAAS